MKPFGRLFAGLQEIKILIYTRHVKSEGTSSSVMSSWSADILVTNEREKTTGKQATTQKHLEARSQGYNGVDMETFH